MGWIISMMMVLAGIMNEPGEQQLGLFIAAGLFGIAGAIGFKDFK